MTHSLQWSTAPAAAPPQHRPPVSSTSAPALLCPALTPSLHSSPRPRRVDARVTGTASWPLHSGLARSSRSHSLPVAFSPREDTTSHSFVHSLRSLIPLPLFACCLLSPFCSCAVGGRADGRASQLVKLACHHSPVYRRHNNSRNPAQPSLARCKALLACCCRRGAALNNVTIRYQTNSSAVARVDLSTPAVPCRVSRCLSGLNCLDGNG